jgi:hypothetical protein
MRSVYRSASFAALVAGSLSSVSQGASAATVSITDQVFTGNAPLTFTPTPVSFSGNFLQSVTGSNPTTVPPEEWLLPGGPPRIRFSPYAFNTGPGPDGSAAATDAPYSVLGAGTGPPIGSATYNVDSTSFTLLWGSADSYNKVAFISGLDGEGSPEGTFTGADLACGRSTCNQMGFDLVTFTASSGGDIGSVVLSNNTSAAFEFGIGIVPLPPSIYLFGSVLGGAFWITRRKRGAVDGLGSAERLFARILQVLSRLSLVSQ